MRDWGEKVNYLKEINAFYDQLEINPLSSSAIALWHTLMHINNKAAWKEQFTVAVSVLCMKSGLREGTFKKARNELKQKGYIDFISRRGNQSAIYKIISLSSNNDRNSIGNSVHNSSDNHDHNRGALTKLKQNETKTKQIPSLANARVINLTEQYFGFISDKDKYLLNDFCDELGEELITEALNRAKAELKGFKYALGIIRNWSQKGIRTMEDVKIDDQQFESYKQKRYGNGNAMPDYDPELDGF